MTNTIVHVVTLLAKLEALSTTSVYHAEAYMIVRKVIEEIQVEATPITTHMGSVPGWSND